MRVTGRVRWFEDGKGYGFIRPDDGSKDVFVHYSEIQRKGFKTLAPDQAVEFDLGERERGRVALNVVALDG